MRLKPLADAIVAGVKTALQRTRAELNQRMDQLETLVRSIPAGASGERGDKGERGEPGESGERGEPGEKGIDGRDGKDGREGRDGKDGAPGRDATEIDILPAIDEAKSYPRGTFARHANGFWRAVGDTQGMRGWECLVAGVAAVQIEQANERSFSLRVELSDGQKVAKDFHLPVVLDRGVYRPENSYLKGDGVTYAGSFWIARADAPTLKPDDPNDGGGGAPRQWRLAVKSGRNGKDGKDGERGPEGKPGRGV